MFHLYYKTIYNLEQFIFLKTTYILERARIILLEKTEFYTSISYIILYSLVSQVSIPNPTSINKFENFKHGGILFSYTKQPM
jgi:hypothetical protein